MTKQISLHGVKTPVWDYEARLRGLTKPRRSIGRLRRKDLFDYGIIVYPIEEASNRSNASKPRLPQNCIEILSKESAA